MERRASNTQLRRQNSGGSMSERSFRAPSPNRPGSQSSKKEDAPPVPKLPEGHQRALSLQPVLSSSREVGPPISDGARRAGLDGEPKGKGPAKIRVDTAPTPGSQVEKKTGDPAKRSSINFSRPISPSSTCSSPETTGGQPGKTAWHTGAVVSPEQLVKKDFTVALPRRSTAPPEDGRALLKTRADRPPTSKKKKSQPPMAGRYIPPTGTMVHKNGSAPAPAPSSASVAPPALPAPPTREPEVEPELYRPPSPKPGPVRAAIADSATSGSEPSSLSSSSPVSTTSSSTTISPIQERIQQARARALGIISKQPSVVHERPREEEEEQNTTTAALPPDSPMNQDSPYPRIANLQKPNDAVSPDPEPRQPRSETEPVSRNRPQSLSPPRAAHFAANSAEILDGIKHNPPGRSASPAKPALKHTPSAAAREPSPASVAPAAPLAVPEKKNRKSVRVSFDESQTTTFSPVEPEPEPPVEDERMGVRPTLPSFGSIRGRKPREDEPRRLDSVRGLSSITAPPPAPTESPEKVTETVASSFSTPEPMGSSLIASDRASASSMTSVETGFSADHAVARVFATAYGHKKDSYIVTHSFDPVPPEVTSVEGTGNLSSSDDEDELVHAAPNHASEALVSLPSARATEQELQTVAETAYLETHPEETRIPDISLMPPTPAADEQPEPKALVFPGGFPESVSPLVSDFPNSTESNGDADPSAHSAPRTSMLQWAPEPYKTSAPTNVLSALEDESSDGESVYSDAEEEWETPGGFASLDAIVESPLVHPVSLDDVPPSPITNKRPTYPYSAPSPGTPPLTTPPPQSSTLLTWVPPVSSGLKKEIESEELDHTEPTDWEKTKAYWTEVNEARRNEAGPVARTAEVIPNPEPEEVEIYIPKPVGSGNRYPVSILRNSTSPEPQPTVTKSKPETGTSVAPVGGTATRKSPKDSGSLESSRYAIKPNATRPVPVSLDSRDSDLPDVSRKGRPMSTPNMNMEAVRRAGNLASSGHAVLSKHAPAHTTVVAQSLQRRDSTGSESSFRKQRKKNRSVGLDGKYTMRRSMRDGAPSMRSASARAGSPPTERPMAMTMRSTLRENARPTSPASDAIKKGRRTSLLASFSPSPGNLIRKESAQSDQSSRQKSPVRSFLTMGKKSKTQNAPPLTGYRFRSRFADSDSDIEIPRPHTAGNTFRSRFADSDDEDNVPTVPSLTPVRSLPHAAGDGDSTDLSDESSVENEHTLQSPISKKEAGIVMTGGQSRQTNGTAANGKAQLNGLQSSKHALPTFESPSSKEKGKIKKKGFFSRGKKEVAVEQQQPTQRPSQQPPPPPSSSPVQQIPKSNKLHRPQRSASENWPLPATNHTNIEEEAEPRPSTSDGQIGYSTKIQGGKSAGLPSLDRPPLGSRSGTVQTEISALGQSGKKKRFQALRRVLRMND